MSDDGQIIEQWKQKYYDQLDRLEKKEQDWQSLEATLKRTIGRLSLAAEGQNTTLDRHIGELRISIKNNINRQRLESIVDDISRILTQLEEKHAGSTDNSSLDALHQLMSALIFQKHLKKSHKKLLAKFDKANDHQQEKLLQETITLINGAISSESVDKEEKPGLLNRLFNSDNSAATQDNTGLSNQQLDVTTIGSVLHHILYMFPWPDNLKAESTSTLLSIKNSSSENSLQSHLKQLEKIIKQWPSTQDSKSSSSTDNLQIYKSCLIDLFTKVDTGDSPNGKLAALKLSAQNANDQSELDNLSQQLSNMLVNTSKYSETSDQEAPQLVSKKLSDLTLQPSIQELLIRLLEQLIVPQDMQEDADNMKHRLEQETNPADWKLLLKDVALLINSIRSRLQKEKHEFENFLQQVTDRLKSLDQFLQSETASLQSAQSQGQKFDININSDVNDLREDLNNATELTSLKQLVNTKLDTVSEHIKLYRKSEQNRIKKSQQEVDEMHSRMLDLEKEAETLKRVVVEKNKQAMFDALTSIPNRLSYEKKIDEEVARWNRFSNPLSLAIWDIDFFKKVNDTYGHKAGDKVLKTVAQLLNKRIRATDFLARYGGEEFVMLLPGTKQEETLRLVNELRQQVEKCGFHYHGNSVKITVSCGVSSFGEGDTINKVFERADKALYEAKETGRNKCVVSSCLSE